MDFELKTEFIQLDKLLKVTGIADSGGMAHALVKDGNVILNGDVVTEKRRKIQIGDVVSFTISDLGDNITVR
ncbi:MAG: RNA-binding S4 domain-containing protein [Negativicutes bacterium]|jgi:ribosome-associated protein